MPSARLRVHPHLRFLLRRDRRLAELAVSVSATDTVGHVVQMVGIPLTEVGGLRLDGRQVGPSAALGSAGGDVAAPALPLVVETPVVEVAPVLLPQRTRTSPPRFLLDVHLGSLARRLRLLGLDAAYETDAEDAWLVDRAEGEGRVLLSRDRGLLSRTALTEGALVRGSRADDQLEEVLRRFAPPLTPWTRCVRCNGTLAPATAQEVAAELEAGTRRTYREFSRCTSCGQVYWRGAHSGPLQAVVRRAEEVIASAGGTAPW